MLSVSGQVNENIDVHLSAYLLLTLTPFFFAAEFYGLSLDIMPLYPASPQSAGLAGFFKAWFCK